MSNTSNEFWKVKISKEKLENLYINQGLTTRDLAKKIGVNQRTLRRYLKRYEISLRTMSEAAKHRKLTQRRLFISKDELKELYLDKGLTITQIAERLGVGRTAIRQRMIRYEIPRRRPYHFKKGNIPWNKGKSFPQIAGEKNYRWNGGYEPYYGPNWLIQRKKARERDGNRCQICGKIVEENGRELDAHHIISFSEYGVERYREANRLENLITLCMSCHSKVELGVIDLESL